MSEEVGAKERLLSLFKHQSSLPAVWHVRRVKKAEAVLSCAQHFSICHRPRRALGKIIDAHHSSDQTTDRLRFQSYLEPVIECATLVRLEMAEPDPPYQRGLDHPCYFLTHQREHASHARVKQQRLVIPHEKLIEL